MMIHPLLWLRLFGYQGQGHIWAGAGRGARAQGGCVAMGVAGAWAKNRHSNVCQHTPTQRGSGRGGLAGPEGARVAGAGGRVRRVGPRVFLGTLKVYFANTFPGRLSVLVDDGWLL